MGIQKTLVTSLVFKAAYFENRAPKRELCFDERPLEVFSTDVINSLLTPWRVSPSLQCL